jgi:molecular chaperone DnaK (HSP70)
VAYALGIDLGTTFTAAATSDGGGVEPLALGASTAAMPSVAFLEDDGSLIVGEQAASAALTAPGRSGSEFKRRMGDATPLLLGGVPYGAEALTGRLIESVLATATVDKVAATDVVVLTHPANWGTYKLELLGEAARLAGLAGPRFVPEPVAAASHVAASDPLAEGAYLLIYDFGGGTFDAAVVRAVGESFELVGTPEGMDRFGGIDIDVAVMRHVLRHVDGEPTDEELAGIRLEAIAGKEALSSSPSTQIGEVRLVRDEFEAMIRPRLEDTLDVLRRTVAGAGLEYGDLSRVVLVGGSSRIPLVADMVRTETGRTVVLEAEPKLAIARGAAQIGARSLKPAATPDMTMPWADLRAALDEAKGDS